MQKGHPFPSGPDSLALDEGLGGLFDAALCKPHTSRL